jgi:hypothetical protein
MPERRLVEGEVLFEQGDAPVRAGAAVLVDGELHVVLDDDVLISETATCSTSTRTSRREARDAVDRDIGGGRCVTGATERAVRPAGLEGPRTGGEDLRRSDSLEPEKGLEPLTCSLRVSCSAV